MIEGIATFTIVTSTMIIATPILSIARPIQRPRPSTSTALALRSSFAMARRSSLVAPGIRG